MNQIKYISTQSIGLGGWVFLLFLGLKLTGFISWSWWWITAPLWLGLAFVLAVFAITGIILAGVAAIAWIASLGGK